MFTFYRRSMLNSSTINSLSSTETSSYLFDTREDLKWQGTLGTDAQADGFYCNIGSTTVGAFTIMLKNHNFKAGVFSTYAGGSVTSAFTFTSNTLSNTMYTFPTVTADQIRIVCSSTMIANNPKVCGEAFVCKDILKEFYNPGYDGYVHTIRSYGEENYVGDGGCVSYRLGKKSMFTLNLLCRTNAERIDLKSIWNTGRDFIFVPWPEQVQTIGSWNGEAYPVTWTGDFEQQFSGNSLNQGYNIRINLEEVGG